MKLLKRVANGWTVLAILFGLSIGYTYRTVTGEMVRTLVYGAAATVSAVLAFNLLTWVFSGATRRGLTAVMELVAFQAMAAAALAGVAGYAMLFLPFVPPGDWTAIEPAPERLVERVDTPFGDDDTWSFRARSVHQNTFVRVCGFGVGCTWQPEEVFLEQEWGEPSPEYQRCQAPARNRMLHSPRPPPDVVDRLVVYLCGPDVTIAIFLALTQDGTVWESDVGTSWGTLFMVIFMLGLSVLLVLLGGAIIGVAGDW